MHTYALSQLTEETLNELVTLQEQPGVSDKWDKMQTPLTAAENAWLGPYQIYLASAPTCPHERNNPLGTGNLPVVGSCRKRLYSSMGRGPSQSYRTLLLNLRAKPMGPSLLLLEVRFRTPYLIVHEAKRGVNAPDPQYQLYGEMACCRMAQLERKRQSRAGNFRMLHHQ